MKTLPSLREENEKISSVSPRAPGQLTRLSMKMLTTSSLQVMLLAVLTELSPQDLTECDFRLVYSRHSSTNWLRMRIDRVCASLFLVDKTTQAIIGVVKSEAAGVDRREAFALFKKHVEVLLDKSVVSRSGHKSRQVQTTSMGRSAECDGARASPVVDDVVCLPAAPPSYQDAVGSSRLPEGPENPNSMRVAKGSR